MRYAGPLHCTLVIASFLQAPRSTTRILPSLFRDSRGHIVTCYHTVKGLAEVKVRAGSRSRSIP